MASRKLLTSQRNDALTVLTTLHGGDAAGIWRGAGGSMGLGGDGGATGGRRW